MSEKIKRIMYIVLSLCMTILFMLILPGSCSLYEHEQSMAKDENPGETIRGYKGSLGSWSSKYIYLYKDKDYKGDYIKVYSGRSLNKSDLDNYGLHDKISSIKVYGGARIRFYRDSDYKGDEMIITEHNSNLHDNNFGDRVSSMNWSVPGNFALCYEHKDYKGWQYIIEHNIYNLNDRGFNNKIYSLKYYGSSYELVLYADSGYGSSKRIFFGSYSSNTAVTTYIASYENNFHDIDFNDNASSARFFTRNQRYQAKIYFVSDSSCSSKHQLVYDKIVNALNQVRKSFPDTDFILEDEGVTWNNQSNTYNSGLVLDDLERNHSKSGNEYIIGFTSKMNDNGIAQGHECVVAWKPTNCWSIWNPLGTWDHEETKLIAHELTHCWGVPYSWNHVDTSVPMWRCIMNYASMGGMSNDNITWCNNGCQAMVNQTKRSYWWFTK